MFFRTTYANEDYHRIITEFFKINTNSDKMNARNKYLELSNLPGKVLVNINGYMQDSLTHTTLFMIKQNCWASSSI